LSQYFLDSSALIKRYVEERGTEWVRAITAPDAGHGIVVAQIAPIEIVSGIVRRARDGSFLDRTVHDTRLLIDLHASREYRVVALTDEVVRRAEDLLEHRSLRASDAVQLASALEASGSSWTLLADSSSFPRTSGC
jgi:uncharacterized protein